MRTVGNYAYGSGFYWHTNCRGGKLRRSRWSRPYYVEPRTYVEYYTEGTFVLDIIDRESQKLVWRASAVRALYNTTPDALDTKMQEASLELLQKFPPPAQVEQAEPPKL